MATDTQESTSLATQQTTALVTVSAADIVPKAPKGLGADEDKQITDRATSLVVQFQGDPQNRSISTQIGSVGTKAQYDALKKSTFLRDKIKVLLTQTISGVNPIPDGLLKLRKEADDLNPEVFLSKQPYGWIGKWLRMVPGMSDVLADIALKYDSAEKTIDAIVDGLHAAALARQADNEELGNILGGLFGVLFNVRKEAYLAELMFQQIQAGLTASNLETEDKQRMSSELQRLILRIQDLRSMEVALGLSLVEINSIMDDNVTQIDTVTRVATNTRFILTVALINQIALARQKKSAMLVVDTMKYNAEVLEATAEAVGLGAVDTEKLLGQPVVALAALKDGYKKLITGLDEAARLRNLRIEAAKKALPEIEAITKALELRTSSIEGVGEDAH